jgi:hypothetical protein
MVSCSDIAKQKKYDRSDIKYEVWDKKKLYMDLMANALFCCNVLPAKRLTET